jgi:hypothetical protein
MRVDKSSKEEVQGVLADLKRKMVSRRLAAFGPPLSCFLAPPTLCFAAPQEEQKRDTGVKYNLQERMAMLEERERQRKVGLLSTTRALMPFVSSSSPPTCKNVPLPLTPPGRKTREAESQAPRDGFRW